MSSNAAQRRKMETLPEKMVQELNALSDARAILRDKRFEASEKAAPFIVWRFLLHAHEYLDKRSSEILSPIFEEAL
jgi:hypothetical protein